MKIKCPTCGKAGVDRYSVPVEREAEADFEVRGRYRTVAKRLMTDNACAYTHNRSPAELLAERGIKHLTTEPNRPRTNRKVERSAAPCGRVIIVALEFPL